MAEFIVGALELAVGDPDSDAFALAEQSLVDILAEVFTETVGGGTEGTNPNPPPHSFIDALYGVSQATIACRAGLKVPTLPASEGGLFGRDRRRDRTSMSATRHRTRLSSLNSRGRF